MILAGVMSLMAGAAMANEPSRAPSVSPEDVQRWLSQGEAVTLLDVRRPEEFAKAHVPGAVNISDESQQDKIGALSRQHPIVVYSRQSRYRAPAAARMLRARGFSNVYVLEGGLAAWQADQRRAHLVLSAPDAPPSAP